MNPTISIHFTLWTVLDLTLWAWIGINAVSLSTLSFGLFLYKIKEKYFNVNGTILRSLKPGSQIIGPIVFIASLTSKSFLAIGAII